MAKLVLDRAILCFGGALAGPAVDALITPAALRLALGNGRGSGGESGEAELTRAGANEFHLRRGRRLLVFRRHGLGWKRAEVRLASG